MEEEEQAQPANGIDPFPRLGDILNHFEAMILRHGELIERMCFIAQRTGVPLDNLEELYGRMVESHKAYFDFKSNIISKPPGAK